MTQFLVCLLVVGSVNLLFVIFQALVFSAARFHVEQIGWGIPPVFKRRVIGIQLKLGPLPVLAYVHAPTWLKASRGRRVLVALAPWLVIGCIPALSQPCTGARARRRPRAVGALGGTARGPRRENRHRRYLGVLGPAVWVVAREARFVPRALTLGAFPKAGRPASNKVGAAFDGSLELWHPPARMWTFLSRGRGRERQRFAESLVCFGMCALLGACAEQHTEPNTPASPPPLQSEADGAEPAPSETKLDTHHLGASVFVVNHVEDFDAFMKFFEEGAAERAKIGVEGQLLSRLDDGRVLVHFVAQDVDRVNQALKSKAMDSYLSREGAPGASIVWLAYNELVTVPTSPPTGQTFSLLLKFPVTDFTAFKRGFEAREAAFAEQSVIAEGLHQSAVDDTIAILHFVGTDRAKLEALPKRPEFGELLSIAGYHGTLEPMVAVDVARSRSAQSAEASAPAPATAAPAAP